MLSDYGHIVSFWMDSIKTHCYVTYETISEASNARNDLYNRIWPPTTGRPLIAEFISEMLSREYIQIENSGGLPQLDKPQEASRPHISHESTTTGERITSVDPATEGFMTQPVSKSLDELFRRTITRPALYYLPLTKRQIEERQASRLPHI
jgi:apoptotic chromatin condensation inducer in the nucleus